MREIKFRGKRISDGDWFYGDLITKVDGDFNITNSYIHIRLSEVNFSEDSMTSKLCLHEVDPKTVGQYTGIEDKNGMEIFEGDITEYGWAITWHNGCLGRWYDGQFASMNELDIERIEVIGNIYANPELLEVTP